MSKPIRIAVAVTIELTTEQVETLASEYGFGESPAEVREWVKDYVRGLATGSPAAECWTATVR